MKKTLVVIILNCFLTLAVGNSLLEAGLVHLRVPSTKESPRFSVPKTAVTDTNVGTNLKRETAPTNFASESKSVRMLRILGLTTNFSYMVVAIETWIATNWAGYDYFNAGEPVALIKYPEWLVGFLGILVATDALRRETKPLRMLGQAASISCIFFILYNWITANWSGSVYFRVGESDTLIKYLIWLVGFLGILVTTDALWKEVDSFPLDEITDHPTVRPQKTPINFGLLSVTSI